MCMIVVADFDGRCVEARKSSSGRKAAAGGSSGGVLRTAIPAKTTSSCPDAHLVWKVAEPALINGFAVDVDRLDGGVALINDAQVALLNRARP